MTPEDFYNSEIGTKTMESASKYKTIVMEYLEDAGFEEIQYFIKEAYDSIEVDFDDQEAVFYIIDDIRKTNYKELFVVDYKKPANSKRHTAVFFWLID